MRRTIAAASMLLVLAACQPDDPGQLVTMEDPPVTGTSLVLSTVPGAAPRPPGSIEIDAPTTSAAAVDEQIVVAATEPSTSMPDAELTNLTLNPRPIEPTTSTTSDELTNQTLNPRPIEPPTTTTAPVGT